MKQNRLHRLFFSYLKEHYKGILLFCLLALIFTLVFFLYALPLEAILYAAALAAVTAFLAFAIDFSRYWKRHQQMQKMQEFILLGTDALPPPRNLTERDYTALLDKMQEEKKRLISAADKIQSDRTDYYTMWAHQIKTPIAALNLLLQTEESEQAEEMLGELFKIEQYVEMVLSYLRLDSSTNDLVIRQYDLDNIIRQAVHKFASQFIRRKIQLHYKPIARKVLTDEKWLLFVLEQLLSNALKYTPPGGNISIYMENNSVATLVIGDNGIGIAPEDLPRVFEKGYTGYNGRRDKKSTGIGLYLCRRILHRLSHTIRIESEPGRGTRVLVDLAHIPLEVE